MGWNEETPAEKPGLRLTSLCLPGSQSPHYILRMRMNCDRLHHDMSFSWTSSKRERTLIRSEHEKSIRIPTGGSLHSVLWSGIHTYVTLWPCVKIEVSCRGHVEGGLRC